MMLCASLFATTCPASGRGAGYRPGAVVMRTSDGTIVEIFEWASLEAIAGARHGRLASTFWTALSVNIGKYFAATPTLIIGDLSGTAFRFATVIWVHSAAATVLLPVRLDPGPGLRSRL